LTGAATGAAISVGAAAATSVGAAATLNVRFFTGFVGLAVSAELVTGLITGLLTSCAFFAFAMS
jgi:hypothetical protein